MLIFHKGHNNTIQVYSVTVMTHIKALQAGQSSQGTSEPSTPVPSKSHVLNGRLFWSNVIIRTIWLSWERKFSAAQLRLN